MSGASTEEALQHYPVSSEDVPPRWLRISLADIASHVSPGFASGQHNSGGSGIPHLRPMNVDRDGKIDLSVVKYVATADGTVLQHGDVLFNNTNSAELIGKTALISSREDGYAFSNHMTRVRLEQGVSPNYIAQQLHFLWMVGYIKHRCTHHVNQASISSKTLANTIPIQLPPAGEQIRIVEKLEELLSDLDAGVAELKAAQKKLAQFRQSLLKAAVEGALTAGWRAERARRGEAGETGAQLLERILRERRARWEAKQLARFKEQGKAPPKGWQDKYPEPVQPDTSELPALPEGWGWATVNQLTAGDLANGRSVPSAPVGAKVLRLTAVRNGCIDLNEYKHGNWSDDEARPFAVIDGDLLVVRGNGSLSLVGRAGLVRNTTDQVAFPDTMIRLRAIESVARPAWLSLVWDGPATRQHLEGRARTSAGIYKISQPDISSVLVPVPPLDEQDVILSIYERTHDTTRSMEAVLGRGLKQSAAQRKNILKSAFSGQLVPQDPNDEPASVLLERIKAERNSRQTGTISPRKPRPHGAKAVCKPSASGRAAAGGRIGE